MLLGDPPLFYPNFGDVPVSPDRRCWGQCEQVPYTIRSWNYFRSVPTHVITIPERHGQTDTQTVFTLPRDATQSAVMRQYVVCLSVRPYGPFATPTQNSNHYYLRNGQSYGL